jgi:16S rRNA (cytosine1407-C5)-methyltransferase
VNQNAAFEAYYRAIYGSRWASLRESLLAPALGAAYDEGLVKPYILDQASVLAAKSLRLPSEVRLSTEAGPLPESGEILDACAAPRARRGEWGRFDAILLDAPCSSERHVLADPGPLALWSAARPHVCGPVQEIIGSY